MFNSLVPDPIVTVIAPMIQTVDQPLTLECNVTISLGITSRVDIFWISNGFYLKNVQGIEFNSTQNNTVVFMDDFTIPQLGTIDEGRLYQCGVMINMASPITFYGGIILDVMGELYV